MFQSELEHVKATLFSDKPLNGSGKSLDKLHKLMSPMFSTEKILKKKIHLPRLCQCGQRQGSDGAHLLLLVLDGEVARSLNLESYGKKT